MPLTAEQFEDLFGAFQKSAFRLQLLPAYEVAGEEAEYARFLAGEPWPERSPVPWLEKMAGQVVQGRTWTNIHLLPETLTPYLRYLIDWWYVYQDQAGARIGFLPPACAREIQALAPHDFWLFDDQVLILMYYDPSGRFLGAEDVPSPDALMRARQARDFALAHAHDFRVILARRRVGSVI